MSCVCDDIMMFMFICDKELISRFLSFVLPVLKAWNTNINMVMYGDAVNFEWDCFCEVF